MPFLVATQQSGIRAMGQRPSTPAMAVQRPVAAPFPQYSVAPMPVAAPQQQECGWYSPTQAIEHGSDLWFTNTGSLGSVTYRGACNMNPYANDPDAYEVGPLQPGHGLGHNPPISPAVAYWRNGVFYPPKGTLPPGVTVQQLQPSGGPAYRYQSEYGTGIQY